jgi:toxin ParE1/3/4
MAVGVSNRTWRHPRATLSRFPYKLLYAIEADYIYLIAVAHQHRKPDYWIGRDTP